MHIYGQISICGFLFGIGIPQYFGSIADLVEEEESIKDSINRTFQAANFNTIIYFITFASFSLWILLESFHRSKKLLHESLQTFLIAMILGTTFSIGLIRSLSNWPERPFSIYICIMTGFHFTEHLVTSITNPSNLNLDSFLLNHSNQYIIAAVFSWFEYFIESYCFPGMKSCRSLVMVGLIACITGEALRKLAMLTASKNFSHIVQSERADGHQLVTHGVYSLCRHPSYAGWFIWAIGTQIVLLNPFCVVAYTCASWKFFYSRIQYEEATLITFFGHEYLEYRRVTKYTGVPFVPEYAPSWNRPASKDD